MKRFYLTQLAIGVVGSLALLYWREQNASLSFFLGVFFASLNVLLIQYVWRRVLGKKSVAWTLFVIVFKYTLLVTTLYFVAVKNWLPVEWFGLGLGTILISVFRTKLEPL